MDQPGSRRYLRALDHHSHIEGIVFVRDDEDPNLDILTLANIDHRIRCGGVPVINERDPFPEEDTVISYVMTLKHIKPAVAVERFNKAAASFGPNEYRSFGPVPNSSALVITDRTPNIRELIALEADIDRP